MPIRPATWADLPLAATVLASAFEDEALFGDIMHPHRQKYPNDMRLWFLQQLRKDFFDPCSVILVSYPATTMATTTRTMITGCCVWTRKGETGPAALRAQQSWASWLMQRIVVPALNWADALVRPNRAADPRKVDILETSYPFVAHHWSSPPIASRRENWYLALCGTRPEAQGKGYGKELVAWGLERARRENVAASLFSAEGKETFYVRCGFGKDIVGYASDGEGNPLANTKGGAIMWMDVEGESKEGKEDAEWIEAGENM